SESQERMLMVIKPEHAERAKAIFEKWELDFAVIGRVTESGHMVLKMGGTVVADLPIAPLVSASPNYDRPWVEPDRPAVLPPSERTTPEAVGEMLLKLIGSADLSSRRWIWEQYDHMVMADTVERPGGDAAVVRVHGTRKGLAVTTDCTPRYCAADPKVGGAQAVAEAWRNLTAVGAKPLAMTDNLNFGNPERPEIMGQFVAAIEGIREAALALNFPIVSGNVSFYNETNGQAIHPTPTIGAVGLIADLDKRATLAFQQAGETLVLIGETKGAVGASIYVREILGRLESAPPPVDLETERRNGDCIRRLIENGMLTACHDIGDGGLGVALTEMALAGNMGAEVTPNGNGLPLDAWLFAEDQGRYLLTTRTPEKVFAAAEKAGVPAHVLGTTGGDALKIAGISPISLARLREAHEGWFPTYMATP
ncbi:MAG: phosphoribosylformylglycinamidine synthase II, partial [Alphaproteobacteria bacterium]|nr:phosphoribosylformylglycinamidine synthase II [Alphaproteobacteria bacterium]